MEKTLPKDVEIAALLPTYTQEGDVTQILLTNGKSLVYRRTMRATLQSLVRRRCKDVTLLRRWASRYTHRTLNNPIAASADLVLVPVKTRRPRVGGDGTMAHINVAALSGPLAEAPERGPRRRRTRLCRPALRSGTEGRTVIKLAGGASLPVLWSEKTMRTHIGAACHIRAELVREEEEAVLCRLSRGSEAAR